MPLFLLFSVGLLLLQPITSHAGEIQANQIQRDPYGTITAKGDVHFQSKRLSINADTIHFNLESQTGDLKNAEIVMDNKHKIQGKKLQRIDLETFYGEDVVYTVCPDDELAWKIVTSSATLDNEDGIFTAKHARFVWAGIPVLYTPYWSHALTRRSGFLMPHLSNSTRRGLQIETPFYWAAAPDWDMTLTPRWMSLRGTMADVEWRHRSFIGQETIQIQSLKDRETGTQRGRLRTDMNWQFSPTIDAFIDVDAVNDGLYIADFPLYSGDRESAAYLTSNAAVTWREGSDSATFSSRYQQVLGGASNRATLQVLPRLQTRNYFDIGGEQALRLDHQTTFFQRDVGVSGLRSGVRPSWSKPWQMRGGAVEVIWSVMGQYVGYNSKNFANTSSSYGALASSLQMETTFEKVFAEQQWRHEIKPIIRFDVSATADQNNQPRYDSSLLPLSLSNLLKGNRYSGWDRFERMRRVSFLLASSLQTKNDGAVRDVLEIQLGLAYDGLKESVDTAAAPTPTESVSNLLAEVSWVPVRGWRMNIGGQHHAKTTRWVESHGGLSWSEQGQYLNMTWRRTDASYSQASKSITLAGKVDINSRWAAHTRNQYDLLRKHVVQSTVGLGYTHACWEMTFEGYKSYQVGTNSLTDLGWRVLLAFDELGSFGEK